MVPNQRLQRIPPPAKRRLFRAKLVTAPLRLGFFAALCRISARNSAISCSRRSSVAVTDSKFIDSCPRSAPSASRSRVPQPFP